MHLNRVTFSGEKYSNIYHDLGDQDPYPSPQWADSNHDNNDDRTAGSNGYPGDGKGYPVSYGRNSAMVTTVSIDIILVPPPPPGGGQPDPPYNLLFRGMAKDLTPVPGQNYYTQVVGYGDPMHDVLDSQNTLTFSPNLLDCVHAWTSMQIDWQFYWGPGTPVNDSAWATFNTSTNDNFITLDKSVAPKLYLTLAYNATTKAEGAPTVTSAVDAMWLDVEGKEVTRTEDVKPLSYYGKWKTRNVALSEMLKDDTTFFAGSGGDAQCKAWAEYWNGLLQAQGIASGEVKAIIATNQTYLERFLVKDWAFLAKNVHYIVGGVLYEWSNSSSHALEIDDFSYLFDGDYAVQDQTGKAGQNRANPLASFVNHRIVLYNGILWDPSYGSKYTSLSDFESKAISGYYIRTAPGGNTVRWYIREKDPNNLGIRYQ